MVRHNLVSLSPSPLPMASLFLSYIYLDSYTTQNKQNRPRKRKTDKRENKDKSNSMEDESHVHGPTRGSPESSPHSDNNKNSNAKNIGNSSSSNNNRDQDRFLPIANVGRIMKKAIPSNGKVSKDAKETVQECVSEFISFVTGEASDKCQREKRKTINGDDLIWAITTLGFDDYVNPLKLYLLKYRELEGEKLTMPKQHHQEQAPPTPQQQQQQQQQQHQHHNMVQLDSSQHSLLYANQPFSIPFSPQQQQNDPRGRW